MADLAGATVAGLADRLTLAEFARRARQGAFTPAAGEARVAQAGSPVRLPGAVGRQVGQIVVSDIKTRISGGVDVRGRPFRPLKHPRPRGGSKPLMDTGRLSASFVFRAEPDAVVVGTNHPGAALQNFGGLVRAKGKMLAIPLTKDAQRAGSPRRFRRGELKFRAVGRRKFLLGTEDKAGRFVGQFLLVDQVRVPPREFFGVSDKAVGQIADALALAGFGLSR